MKDLYSILGIDVNASPTDVREAYRKLSKKFHPDLNENDLYFENRFKEIREAYELLSDPVGRAAYVNQLKKFRGYPVPLAEQKQLTGKSSVNTKINWAFTAMLLMLTSLFAYYVVRSVTHTKTPKVAAVSETANATLVTRHKKHRRKKNYIIQAVATKNAIKTKPFADTISAKAVKPSLSRDLRTPVVATGKPKPTQLSVVSTPTLKPVATLAVMPPKTAPVQSTTVVSARPAQTATVPAPASKPAQQSAATAMTVMNSQPANNNAYIKANATGVVYMRQTGDYQSDVVSVIPGDSKILALEKGSNFYKISYNNKTGYVPNWTVQFR